MSASMQPRGTSIPIAVQDSSDLIKYVGALAHVLEALLVPGKY